MFLAVSRVLRLLRYVARCRADTELYGKSFADMNEIEDWLEFSLHEAACSWNRLEVVSIIVLNPIGPRLKQEPHCESKRLINMTYTIPTSFQQFHLSSHTVGFVGCDTQVEVPLSAMKAAQDLWPVQNSSLNRIDRFVEFCMEFQIFTFSIYSLVWFIQFIHSFIHLFIYYSYLFIILIHSFIYSYIHVLQYYTLSYIFVGRPL